MTDRGRAASARRAPAAFLLVGAATAAAIVLAIAAEGRFSTRTGYAEAARDVQLADWWTLWAVPPVEIVLIGLLAITLWTGLRGRPTGRQLALVSGALTLLLLAVASPIGGLAQGGLFAAHMFQHVLIGAIAPLLVLLALPSARGATRPPRGLLAVLLHPVVAFVLWVTSTIVWLIPDVHHEVLTHQGLWIAQQVSFFAFGVVMWAPITERFAPSPRWFGTSAKCGYMFGVWTVGLILANFYWLAGRALYTGHTAAADAWGISPLQDQSNAATVMMASHCLIAFTAITVLFFRHAREQGLQQRLVEAGVAPELARAAILRGEAEILAGRVGVAVRTRAGID